MLRAFSIISFLLAGVATYAVIEFMAPHVYHWHNAKSWTEVSAQLVSHKLNVIENKRRDDEGRIKISKVYNLSAKYIYTLNAQRFIGERVSFSDVMDGNESYYQTINARLNNASENGGEISIWVDPHNPSQAVIDRDFRTYNFILILIVSTIFGAFGYTGVYLQCKSWYRNIFGKNFHHFRVDAAKQHFTSYTLPSQDHASKIVLYALFAMIVGFIAIGMQVAVMAIIKNGPLYVIGPILMLAFISIPAYAGFKVYQRNLHLGSMPLTIDRYPIIVGNKLSGNVLIKKTLKTMPSYTSITVCCNEVYEDRGKIKDKKLWVESQDVTWIKDGRHHRLYFSFEIPQGLPEPMQSDEKSTVWWLEVTIGVPKKDEFSKVYNELAIFQA